MLTAGMSTRVFAHDLNAHFTTIYCLWLEDVGLILFSGCEVAVKLLIQSIPDMQAM